MPRRRPGHEETRASTNRRRHARVPASVPIAAHHGGQAVQIEASNICEEGAYCQGRERVPVMTRMAVSIELPPVNGEIAPRPLRLDAVVVRCDPHPFEGGVFSLALFFPSLDDSERRRIARFVQGRREGERLALEGLRDS